MLIMQKDRCPELLLRKSQPSSQLASGETSHQYPTRFEVDGGHIGQMSCMGRGGTVICSSIAFNRILKIR